MSTARTAERTATAGPKGTRTAAFGIALGLITAAGATAVIGGWLAGAAALVRSRPGPATLPFNGALALGALGLAVAALCWRLPPRRPRWVVGLTTAASALAGALAAGALIEDLSRGSLGIDALFVRDVVTTAGHAGRPAPETSLAILLLAVALLVEAWRPGRARVVAWVGAAASAITVVAATELAGSSQQLFGLLGSSRVAVPAVVLLAFVAIAVQVAVGDRAGAVYSLWVEHSVRASMLRVFVLPLPIIAAVPIVVCTALVNHAHPGAGRIVSELGTATLAVLMFVNALVGHRVAARMTRPLAAMAADAGQIADGDLAAGGLAAGAAAAREVRMDEIGHLAAAFDGMRADLLSQARGRWVINEARARASTAPDLTSAFGAFVDRLGAEIRFDRATYLRPDETGEFRAEAIAGPSDRTLAINEMLPLDLVRSTRMLGPESVVIDDLSTLPDETGVAEVSDRLIAVGMRSLLTVPTVAGGEVRSLFTFASHVPGVFGVDEAGLLRSAVREAAVVFDMLVNLDRERSAVERLEEIDRQKNEFVNMVAHDLRSPMGVIAGFADTLRMRWDRLSALQREEFLNTICRNINGLSAMVEDMLDVARIESGDYTYDISPFALDALVRETTTEVIQSFGPRETVIAADDSLPLANADEQRVWQVLSNLLSNACKFSEPHESVTVKVTADGQMLRVAVADNGPGVALEDRDHIFDKYARLPAAPGRRHAKGTGLGLYICKLLVEAQDGQIGVESGLGGGATFWFTVPAAPGNAAAGPTSVRKTSLRR